MNFKGLHFVASYRETISYTPVCSVDCITMPVSGVHVLDVLHLQLSIYVIKAARSVFVSLIIDCHNTN